jgi:hypothetical protein
MMVMEKIVLEFYTLFNEVCSVSVFFSFFLVKIFWHRRATAVAVGRSGHHVVDRAEAGGHVDGAHPVGGLSL